MKAWTLYTPLLIASIVAIAVAQYFIFLVVPTERVMGAAQRIFYFHVGSAIACYVAFAVVLIASLSYLATRDWKSDAISAAAGEVGFVFCTITLLTGMVWGRTAWNTWFSWSEPRLVTFLVLWLIFLMFSILRNFGDPEKTSLHASILGILGSVSVPIVQLSIKLLPKSAQLHPEVVAYGRLEHWSYWWAFGISVFALTIFLSFLIVLRTRIAFAERLNRYREFEEKLNG